MSIGADILVVIATLVSGFSIASLVAGWVSRELPVMAAISLGVGIALFAYVHVQTGTGLRAKDIPDAFILVAARILN